MLDRLSPRPGARKRRLRIGRGPGSGKGKTGGRGVKGQGTRSAGRPTPLHFEGGQMPIARRLPKRGFTNLFRERVRTVNLGALAVFGDGATVDEAALGTRGLVRGKKGRIKLLGEGESPRNLTVKVHAVSESARRKVEAAGGTVEII